MRILVVDDIHDLRIFIKETLNENGYNKIVLASNGLEAFRFFSENHVDVIICDVDMPIMSGTLLRKKIEEHPKECPPFILFTGYTLVLNRDENFDSSKYYAILEKPTEIKTLINHIHEIEERLRPV